MNSNTNTCTNKSNYFYTCTSTFSIPMIHDMGTDYVSQN